MGAVSIVVQVKCGTFVYQTFTFDGGSDDKIVGFPSWWVSVSGVSVKATRKHFRCVKVEPQRCV